MDSIEEILLLLGSVVIIGLVLVYTVPTSSSLGSTFQGQAISQIILNSFKLKNPQIIGSQDQAIIYDNGYPTTLLVVVDAYSQQTGQLIAQPNGELVSFVSGPNPITLPPLSNNNTYYAINLYSSDGSVLYTTFYVDKYINNYVNIQDVINNAKIYINGKLVSYIPINNSDIFVLPDGTYYSDIYTPYYYNSSTFSFSGSSNQNFHLPLKSQLSYYTLTVDQKLPNNVKLNPLVDAVIAINNNSVTYKTNSNGQASIPYSTNGLVSINVSCPQNICGTAISDNYSSFSNNNNTISYYTSNPIILHPRFRIIGSLYLTCNGTKTLTPGIEDIVATPLNSSLNKYLTVNATGKSIAYLYAGEYNITATSLSGLFNYTTLNVVSQNQTYSISFNYCPQHIPSNETIFYESGLPSGTTWNATYDSMLEQNTTSKIIFHVIGTGNYTYTIPIINVNGNIYYPEPKTGAVKPGNQVNINYIKIIPTLTITPNPATYGQSVTITATCPLSTDTCAIDYPTLGTAIATGTGSATYTYNSLPVGTYSSFYANDITWNKNSTPQSLVVNPSLPSGIVYSVPINITNSQAVATSSPFQQMINITESSFSNYIVYNNNFANFEYFYPNDTIIPAWIESNSSGKLITWVKTISIPASSHIQIYLGFASKTTNLLSSSGTSGIGEAPQLSSTYAEYDDGASVFTKYWNFAGTSLPSGWTSSVGSSSGSVTVNNGVTLASGTGGSDGWGTINYEFTMPSSNQITVEVYGETTETGRQRMYLTNTGATAECGGYGSNLGFDYGIFGSSEITSGDLQYYWNGYYSPSNSNFAINTPYIVQYLLSGSTFYWNILSSTEQSIASQSTTQPSSTNVLSLMDDDDSGATQSTYYWIRIRAYPPNGVMPSVLFS